MSSTDKSSEILPCPLCGSEAELMVDELDMSCTSGTVMCMSCYATGPQHDDYRKAVEAWNTRATVNPWVVIGDIPDEWKDGRPLLLLGHNKNICLGKWVKITASGQWKFAGYAMNEGNMFYWSISHFTHAMLPPEPPK